MEGKRKHCSYMYLRKDLHLHNFMYTYKCIFVCGRLSCRATMYMYKYTCSSCLCADTKRSVENAANHCSILHPSPRILRTPGGVSSPHSPSLPPSLPPSPTSLPPSLPPLPPSPPYLPPSLPPPSLPYTHACTHKIMSTLYHTCRCTCTCRCILCKSNTRSEFIFCNFEIIYNVVEFDIIRYNIIAAMQCKQVNSRNLFT